VAVRHCWVLQQQAKECDGNSRKVVVYNLGLCGLQGPPLARGQSATSLKALLWIADLPTILPWSHTLRERRTLIADTIFT